MNSISRSMINDIAGGKKWGHRPIYIMPPVTPPVSPPPGGNRPPPPPIVIDETAGSLDVHVYQP